MIISCVYCGHEYQRGTPASGADSDVLTAHIRECKKHPMAAMVRTIRRIRMELQDQTQSDTETICKVWSVLDETGCGDELYEVLSVEWDEGQTVLRVEGIIEPVAAGDRVVYLRPAERRPND